MGVNHPHMLRIIPDHFQLRKCSQILSLFYQTPDLIWINMLGETTVNTHIPNCFRNRQNLIICKSVRQIIEITSARPNKIFRIIITEDLGNYTFMQLQSILNINHLYVYGKNLEQLQKLKKTFNKIKIISNQVEDFYQKILEYHAIDNKQKKICRFIKTNLNDAAINRFQLNLLKFLNLENKSQAKKDFISLAKYIRRNQLPDIQDFQTNYPNNLDQKTTIKWYTRHNFYEYLLNTIIKASYDLNQVGYIRLPFHDMFHTIKKLYIKQQKKQLLVYKAIKLEDEQLNLIEKNIGKTLQIVQFMSATKNLSQTQVVLDKNALLIINISKQNLEYNNQYGFGDISTLGIPDEEQIIFNPLNKFQVLKIQKFNKIKKIYLKYGSIGIMQRKNSSDFKIRKSKKQDEKKIIPLQNTDTFMSPSQNVDSIIKNLGKQEYNTINLVPENSSSKQILKQINEKSISNSKDIRIQSRNQDTHDEDQKNKQHLLKILESQKDRDDKIIQEQIIKQGINNDQTQNLTYNKANQQQKNNRQMKMKDYPQLERSQDQKINKEKKYEILKSKSLEKVGYKTQRQFKSPGISTAYDFLTSRISFSKSKQIKPKKVVQEDRKSNDLSPVKESEKAGIQDYFMLNKVYQIYSRLNLYNRYIWVDSNINATQNRINLSSFNEFYLTKPCDSVKQAAQFVSKYPNDYFCVISSLSIGEQICKYFKENKSVIHIYIFTAYSPKGQLLKSRWQKVNAVCTTLNDLLSKITKEIKFTSSKLSPRFIRTNQDKFNQYAIYNFYGLLTMANIKRAKQDFVKISTYLYGQQQSFINKFINQYNLNQPASKVIEWYLSNNFFRRTLDTLLKYSSDIMELGYIRLPFVHLLNAIKQIYQNDRNQQITEVYRGDRLSEAQIKLLKQNSGKFVKLLGFLTASKTKKKAQQFLKNAMFTIKIKGKPKSNDIDFGYVDSSKLKIISQQEILFNTFNIFKIQKVETSSSGITTVILKYGQFSQILNKSQNSIKLSSNEEIELNNYKQMERNIKKNIRNEGDVLFQCQRYDQAIKYRKKLFEKYKFQGISETTQIGQLFNQIGISYKYKGELDKAFEYYEQSLKIFKKTVGKNHEYTAIAYNNIADIFKQKQLLDDSLKYYLKCTKSYLSAHGKNNHFIINCYNSIANIYAIKKQFDKALQFYQKSLKIEQSNGNSKQTSEVANCLINIGLVYRTKGQLNQCLQYLFQALKIRVFVFGENHKLTLQTYHKIAQLYKQIGDIEKAIQYFTLSLEVSVRLYGKNNVQVAKLYNQIGLLHRQKKDLDKSLEAQNQSLKIYTSLFGKNNVQTAIVYNNIGQIYRQKQQYTKALEYLIDSSKIFSETIGQITDKNATTYNNIGCVYYSKGDFDNAHQYFYKSLKIRKVILGQKNADTATSYNNIGEIYRSKGELDKALQFFTKSLSIRLNVLGPQHIETAISYNNLAQVYRSKQQLDKSLDCYIKALAILKNAFGSNHQTILQSYNNIGLVWRQKGSLDKALKYQFKSFQIRIYTYGLNHLSNATSYNNIGIIYFLKGQYDKALQNYENCLKAQIASYGENHSTIATSYNNIGEVYKQKKQYNKALEYYTKSLKIAKSNYGENHLLTATCYNNIGSVYYLKKELDKGLQFYTKSFNIQKDKFGENHSSTATSYSNLGLIHKEKGDKQKALEFFQKSLKIYSNIFGQNHRATATTYFNVGNLYRSSQSYTKAFENFKKSYQIRKKIMGQGNSDTKLAFSLMKQAQKLK